jgi:ribosomal protein S12 methylthiotransferase accessory factor
MNAPAFASRRTPDQKACTRGTHRACLPAETVQRLRPQLAGLGITRVANVTGLDHLSIPVCQACRPTSRSLAVSQGKGLDLDAAKASAIMESAECHHAENMRLPLHAGTLLQMHQRGPVLDVERLARVPGSPFHARWPVLWVQGEDWMGGGPVFLPYQLVHTNYVLAGPHRMEACSFVMSTNGLASGNHVLEAASHALCEVIERHACHVFARQAEQQRAQRRLRLASVDDADCRAVVDRLQAAGMEVVVWEVGAGMDLPVFECRLAEQAPGPLTPTPSARGFGCHPSREIALLRALTEAAQSRLTLIAGARDDIVEWHDPVDPGLEQPADEPPSQAGPAALAFDQVPTQAASSFEADLALELQVLRSLRFEQAVVLDLSQPEFDFAVVRVVVPGARCEDHGRTNGSAPRGARA